MFCSGCGTELEAGLNFCKRCGNRVASEEPSRVAETLSGALGFIGGFGLVGFVAIVVVLSRSETITPGLFGLIAAFYLSTLFGICYMILQQTAPFTIRIGHRKPESIEVSHDKYVKPVTTARLSGPSEMPISSVTEQTTRNLDPITRK